MSWSQIPGRAAYLWIYDEWIASNPREGAIVVEVGVGLGKSIAYLCEALDKAGRDDVIVYGVDIWNGEAINGEQQTMAGTAGGCFSLYAKQMLEHAPKAFERANVIRLDSVHAMGLFYDTSLVILDSDHTYERVRGEIDVWLDLEQSGWIGGDDFMPQHPGVEKAVRESFGDDIELRYDCGWGTWLHRGSK